MDVIQANCRHRLTAADFAFLATTLARDPAHTGSVAQLLTDETARDAALDSERVLAALIEAPGPAPVSPHLYFYVLTRRVLPQLDRTVADYIANVLATFLDLRRLRAVPGEPDQQADHLADLLTLVAAVSGDRAFLLRAQVGNVSLFLAGIFPEQIQARAHRHAAPGLDFYEAVGRTNYRLAADYRQARSSGLAPVLHLVAERFSDVRQGLNQMTDRYLFLAS